MGKGIIPRGPGSVSVRAMETTSRVAPSPTLPRPPSASSARPSGKWTGRAFCTPWSAAMNHWFDGGFYAILCFLRLPTALILCSTACCPVASLMCVGERVIVPESVRLSLLACLYCCYVHMNAFEWFLFSSGMSTFLFLFYQVGIFPE